MEIKFSELMNIKPVMTLDCLWTQEAKESYLKDKKEFIQRLYNMKRDADANYTHAFVSVDEVLRYIRY